MRKRNLPTRIETAAVVAHGPHARGDGNHGAIFNLTFSSRYCRLGWPHAVLRGSPDLAAVDYGDAAYILLSDQGFAG